LRNILDVIYLFCHTEKKKEKAVQNKDAVFVTS